MTTTLSRTAARLAASLPAVAIGLWVFGAAAAVIPTVTPGVHHQTGQDNVIGGGSCASHVDGPALLVQGCLNGDHSILVNFESDELVIFNSGGQARVEEVDGGYSQLEIYSPGHDILALILNIDTSANGWVRFTANGVNWTDPFALGMNGSNFFTLTGGPFSLLGFKTFSDFAGTTEADIVSKSEQHRLVVQVRDTPPSEIPEPAPLAMLALGALALGLRRSRSKK